MSRKLFPSPIYPPSPWYELFLPGDEICENYGFMYTTKLLADRRKVLKDHYKFDCICKACTQKWPTLAEMKATILNDPGKRLINEPYILKFAN